MVHISRERHKQCLLAAKRLVELDNLTNIAHGPFSSHRNALRVDMNLCLSTREIAHMRNPNFRHYYYSSLIYVDLGENVKIDTAEVRMWLKQQTAEVLFKINRKMLGRLALTRQREAHGVRYFDAIHHSLASRTLTREERVW